MQGAGGVRGLLAVNLGTNGTHFACFDGNGNVTALLNANSSTLTALYEYDPFGHTLRATGPTAEANSLRFSTQFADDVTRRVKYLFRDYDAGGGGWLNRDPIQERGGVRLHGFAQNDPVNIHDNFGLAISWTGINQEDGHGSFEFQSKGPSGTYKEIMGNKPLPGDYSVAGGSINSAVINAHPALHAWARLH